MMDKYITADGKKYLLQLGFLSDDTTSNFNFAALGVGESNASQNNGEGFFEANGNNYHRVQLLEEQTSEDDEQSISISATFDSTNFNPSEAVTVSEIGIVNQDIANDNDKWFAFLKVPPIDKASNVSLKYTIIISIE